MNPNAMAPSRFRAPREIDENVRIKQSIGLIAVLTIDDHAGSGDLNSSMAIEERRKIDLSPFGR
jgi:hypothetical protein